MFDFYAGPSVVHKNLKQKETHRNIKTYELITLNQKQAKQKKKKALQAVGLEPTNPKEWCLKPTRLTTSLHLRNF